MAGNTVSVVSRDGMTRAPVVRFSRAYHAHEAKLWLQDEDNHRLVMDAFNSTSRSLHCNVLLLVLRDYSTHLSAFFWSNCLTGWLCAHSSWDTET